MGDNQDLLRVIAELASRAADVVRLLANPGWLAKVEASHRELRGHGTILETHLGFLGSSMEKAQEIIEETLRPPGRPM